ncbi:MAG: hypothetical protein ACYTXE_29845 [Nostoc sp.]
MQITIMLIAVDTVNQKGTKTAEILTAEGLQASTLIQPYLLHENYSHSLFNSYFTSYT